MGKGGGSETQQLSMQLVPPSNQMEKKRGRITPTSPAITVIKRATYSRTAKKRSRMILPTKRRRGVPAARQLILTYLYKQLPPLRRSMMILLLPCMLPMQSPVG